MTRRHPKGTTNGGRFAPDPRREATVDLNPAPALPVWEPSAEFPPLHALETREGAFDQCKSVSAAYTRHLRDHGLDVTWVQVCAPTTELPDADPRWHSIDRVHWQHYVTRVTTDDGSVHYVDWTHRQFEPTSTWPLVEAAEEFEARWTDRYDIPSHAIDR